MTAAAPRRRRLELRQPQAVQQTTVLDWPADPARDRGRLGLVLAPSAGAQVTQPAFGRIAAGLAARGFPVLALNFAYAEAGRRLPDPPARLESAFRDAVAFARRRLRGRALVLGGRSIGGRIASHLAAAGEPCAGLALLGYPLHPAGRPERLRTAHWPELKVPVLFVQGDRDALCDLDLLERERRQHLRQAPTRVHVLGGADHALRVGGRARAETLDEVVAAVVAGWLEDLTGSAGQFAASAVGYSGSRRPDPPGRPLGAPRDRCRPAGAPLGAPRTAPSF